MDVEKLKKAMDSVWGWHHEGRDVSAGKAGRRAIGVPHD